MAVAIPVIDAVVEQDPIPFKLNDYDDSSVSSAEEDSATKNTPLIPNPHRKRLKLTYGVAKTGCFLILVLGAGGFFFYCLYLVIRLGAL